MIRLKFVFTKVIQNENFKFVPGRDIAYNNFFLFVEIRVVM